MTLTPQRHSTASADMTIRFATAHVSHTGASTPAMMINDKPSSKRSVILLMNDEHRAVRMFEHVVRHGAEAEAAREGPVAPTQNHQVNPLL